MQTDDRKKRIHTDAPENVENQPVNEQNREGTENSEEEGILDLDGDGMIGETGGFYGGTSYLGSNYGPGWNAPENDSRQNEGNFGAAGQRDTTEDTDDNGDNPPHLTRDDAII